MASRPTTPPLSPSRVEAILIGVLVTLALGAAGCAGGTAAGPTTAGTGAAPGSAVITRVVDGDTIVVDLDGRSEKVRLLGVDTPETKSPTKPVQCFGKEASAATEALLPVGTVVHMERDTEERDAYGRLLAYVYRSDDGLFVNLALAQGGFASALPITPNTTHAAELGAAVDDAHQRQAGLWGACGGPGRPAG